MRSPLALLLVCSLAMLGWSGAALGADERLAGVAQDDDEGDDDPWSEEAEQLLEESERSKRADKPGGPADFIDSPWAAPLLVAGATTLAAILYAGAFVATTGGLYQVLPRAPGWILFAGFLAAPLLPAAAGGLTTILVARWWKAAITLAGALLGGGLGVVMGMAGLFLVGPLLPDPATFIWFAGLGVPLIVTVASTVGTSLAIPLVVDLVEDTLGWELPRALADKPSE